MRVGSFVFPTGVAVDVAVVGVAVVVVEIEFDEIVVGVGVVEIELDEIVEIELDEIVEFVVGVGVGEVGFGSPVALDVVGTSVVGHVLGIGEFCMVLGRVVVVGVVELGVEDLRLFDDALSPGILEILFPLFCNCRFLAVV